MTMVDACTNWVELAIIPTANSKSCAIQFDTNGCVTNQDLLKLALTMAKNLWGRNFRNYLSVMTLRANPTSVKNPTFNYWWNAYIPLGDQLRVSIYSIYN